jgi:hypothetical protein
MIMEFVSHIHVKILKLKLKTFLKLVLHFLIFLNILTNHIYLFEVFPILNS